MIVKCWNCGNTMEKTGVEEYRSSLLTTIKKLESTTRTVGDKYSADAYAQVIFLIENFK